MDVSALNGAPPAKEPERPIHVSGTAYAKIIDGMINVGYYAERATPDGGSERVIVAKLVFPGTACTVARAIAVNQALLEGAVREEAERHGRAPRPLQRERVQKS